MSPNTTDLDPLPPFSSPTTSVREARNADKASYASQVQETSQISTPKQDGSGGLVDFLRRFALQRFATLYTTALHSEPLPLSSALRGLEILYGTLPSSTLDLFYGISPHFTLLCLHSGLLYDILLHLPSNGSARLG